MRLPPDSWEIINLDTEAADKAEKEASEVEQLRQAILRYEEERKLMIDETTQLKEMLKREVNQAETDKTSNIAIINDYKLVRQRLDTQLHEVKAELDSLKAKISNCDKCCQYLTNSSPDKKAGGDDGATEEERIRELELELAQTKLAHVEAECRNQNLTHQLRATELELTTAKNSWPPWLSKTLTSIKEVANKKEFTGFGVPHPNIPSNTPTFISHINVIRRESVPLKQEKTHTKDTRRESVPIIKDSQSCSSLKSHN